MEPFGAPSFSAAQGGGRHLRRRGHGASRHR